MGESEREKNAPGGQLLPQEVVASLLPEQMEDWKHDTGGGTRLKTERKEESKAQGGGEERDGERQKGQRFKQTRSEEKKEISKRDGGRRVWGQKRTREISLTGSHTHITVG